MILSRLLLPGLAAQRREQFNESFYADLPSRYKIVIEDKLSDDNLMANRVEPQ